MQRNDPVSEKRFVSSFLVPIIAVTTYVIICFILSRPFLGSLALNDNQEESLLTAIGYEQKNAAYHFMLGRYYDRNLMEPEPQKAIHYYMQSLDISPLQPAVWLDLSRTYKRVGQQDKAEHALARAVRLSPNNAELMWKAGSFWLINNMTEKAVSAFKRYLLLAPHKQTRVYDLCWKFGLDNSYLLERLIPDSYDYRSTYLAYLMRTKRIGASQETWSFIDLDRLDKKVFISYMNFMINNRLYDEATAVWKNITSRIEGLSTADFNSPVWNPSFEDEILNGGFDWMVRETEGVDIFLDDTIRMDGSRSLGITFDGKHNPGITIARQIVTVHPLFKYSLRGHIKTDSLTTTNGVFVNVYGHQCSGINKNSDIITGTNLWREVTIDFETPSECNAVVVRVQRARSNKLHNKIEGTAWIDLITLKQIRE
jgi:hypothetical protein